MQNDIIKENYTLRSGLSAGDLYAKKIISVKVNNDSGFGSGTEKATNELLKRLGYKQNGIAGSGLIKALGEMLTK